MASTTATSESITNSKVYEVLRKIFVVLNDNLWSAILTIILFGIAASTYFAINPLHSAWAIMVTFFIYLDLLAIRIVRAFDDSWTVNELADRVIEMEESINQQLDAIRRQM
jgi:hypothetical protein